MPSLKKITIVLAVVVAAGAAAWAYTSIPVSAPTTIMETNYKTITLRIGSASVVAEVADTDALRSRGLSGRAHLPEGQGMWFIFDTDGLWSFWMKDTLIPLDMLWVDAQGSVVYIAHNVRPESYPQSYQSSVPARYVLEVPGGWAQARGVVEGDRVEQQ